MPVRYLVSVETHLKYELCTATDHREDLNFQLESFAIKFLKLS